MRSSKKILAGNPNAKTTVGKSTRAIEFVQTESCGCDIITATPDLIKKIENVGKDLDKFSLETVSMFYNDALQAGFSI